MDDLVEPLGQHIKGAVRSTFKKSKTDTLREKTGRSANYAGATSFTGTLLECLAKKGLCQQLERTLRSKGKIGNTYSGKQE